MNEKVALVRIESELTQAKQSNRLIETENASQIRLADVASAVKSKHSGL